MTLQSNNIIQGEQVIPGDLPFDYQGEALDFKLSVGKVTSIIGSKYSGKSQWLKAMCGLNDPLSGSVYIHGINTFYLSSTDWTMMRMKVAYLHADTALLSAANGLSNVLAPAIYHQLYKDLSKQSLTEKALILLDEIDPELNLHDLPAYISKEHQFKIAVARALMLKPDVLVLNNPFTHYDNDTKYQFQNYLANKVKDGLSILITTNDITFALNHSDNIIFAEQDMLHCFDSKSSLESCTIPSINEYMQQAI